MLCTVVPSGWLIASEAAYHFWLFGAQLIFTPLWGLTSAGDSLDAAAAFSTVPITQQITTLGD